MAKPTPKKTEQKPKPKGRPARPAPKRGARARTQAHRVQAESNVKHNLMSPAITRTEIKRMTNGQLQKVVNYGSDPGGPKATTGRKGPKAWASAELARRGVPGYKGGR